MGEASPSLQSPRDRLSKPSAAVSSATPSTGAKSASDKNSTSAPVTTPSVPEKKRKLSYKEQKEFEALETEIMELEERKTELEGIMSGTTGDFSQLESATKEYNELTATLEAKYSRWEELASIAT